MNYRIILMGSGLLMMFAVYGFVMMIGAIVGGNDAVMGNGILAGTFTILTLIMLRIGLYQRKKAGRLFENIIAAELDEHGSVDAQRFATACGVTLDDARDVLDRMLYRKGWDCLELDGYNAMYTPQ
jgi:hypothetical protein